LTPALAPAAPGAAAAAPAATFLDSSMARIGSWTGGGAGAPGGRGMIVSCLGGGVGSLGGLGINCLATARMFLSRLLMRLSISFVDFSKLSKTSNRLRTTSMISAGPPCFHGVSPVSSFLRTLHVYCPSPLGGFLGNFLMPFAAVSAGAPGAGVVTFFAGAGFDILQAGLERDKGRGSRISVFEAVGLTRKMSP